MENQNQSKKSRPSVEVTLGDYFDEDGSIICIRKIEGSLASWIQIYKDGKPGMIGRSDIATLAKRLRTKSEENSKPVVKKKKTTKAVKVFKPKDLRLRYESEVGVPWNERSDKYIEWLEYYAVYKVTEKVSSKIKAQIAFEKTTLK